MRIRPRRSESPHPVKAAAKKAADNLAKDVEKMVTATKQELIREQRVAAGLSATPGILERIISFFQAIGRLFSRAPAAAASPTKVTAAKALDLAKTAHMPADGAGTSPRSVTDPAARGFSPTEFADDVTDPKSGAASDGDSEHRSPHE